MKIRTTLALIVFAASLANATLAYIPPEIDWSVPLLDSLESVDVGLALSAGSSQQDAIEPEGTNVVKYVSPEDPLAPDAAPMTTWLELFHER